MTRYTQTGRNHWRERQGYRYQSDPNIPLVSDPIFPGWPRYLAQLAVVIAVFAAAGGFIIALS